MDKTETVNLPIEPRFPDIRKAIVFTLDRGYLKQLSVMLQSLIDYSSSDARYDLIVFEKDFTEQDKILLSEMCLQNIHIRFFDINGYVQTHFPEIKFYTRSYWSEAMWYKCFIPFVMPAYQKVCYLDVDAVIQYDINNIFDLTNPSNSPLMAVRDILSYQINRPDKSKDKKFLSEIDIKHHTNYFNAGMLLFNIHAIDIPFFKQKFLGLYTSQIKFKCPEQDVLNSIFNENVAILPFQYNYQIQLAYSPDFERCFYELEGYVYQEVKKNPLFIHYFGAIKPWHLNDQDIEYFDLFWRYAKKTPFYQELLEDLHSNTEQLEAIMSRKKSIRFSYVKTRLLSKLASGSVKENYESEFQRLKNQLLKIKTLSLKASYKQICSVADRQIKSLHMTCYLINLDRSPDRLEFISEQFRYLHSLPGGDAIDWIRIQAVDAETLDEETINIHYDKKHYSFNARFFPNVVSPGGMTKGEIACFLSHRKCWQQIVNGKEEYAVVLEDDVIFSSDAVSFLSQANWIPSDADIIKMEVLTQKLVVDIMPAHNWKGREIVRFYSSNLGTAAYVISKKAAKRLLQKTEKFYIPIDHVMFGALFPFFYEFVCYQIIPAICVQDTILRGKNSAYKSMVNTRQDRLFQRVKKFMSLGTKVKREWVRFILRVKVRAGFRKRVHNSFNRDEAFILEQKRH